MDNSDFAALIEPVAKILLKDKPQSRRGKELRYGTKGGLKIDLEKGTWSDFEGDNGGGVLDLIVRERGGTPADAMEWLRDQGLIARPNVSGANGAHGSAGARNGASRKIEELYDSSAPDDDACAIRLVDVVLDELELAGRPPGELVTITRQANDSCINDLAIVRRLLIRKMVDR
jgi:hypothetical protein